MGKILWKKVSGDFIMLETETGYKVLGLRDWNLNRRNAEILFSAKTMTEALAYENWARSALERSVSGVRYSA